MFKLSKELAVTLTMMLTMAVGSSCILAVAVAAPDAAPDIGVPATQVGLFTGFVYFVSMFTGTFSTGFIAKFGPIRVLQFSALSAICGMVVFTFSTPFAVFICAVLLGIAYGPINPANAPVLVKVTTERNRAFLFSIKQSGVTVGGAFAAVAVPAVIVWWNWQAAVLTIALLGLFTLIVLHPLRNEFDRDRINIPTDWSLTAVFQPVNQIFKIPLLRGFAMVGFTYAGVQISVSSFFVVYLVEQGFSLVEAGVCFLFVNIGGIVGRIIWGGVSDKWLTPKYTLAAIGLISTLSLFGMLLISESWSNFLLYVFSSILGCSTHGWNGVFLSEVANQAPKGESHNWTGGVQFLIYGGVAVIPPIFGVIIVATESYTYPFMAIAVVTIIASLSLLWLYRVYSEFR